jgi:hypothetical protein
MGEQNLGTGTHVPLPRTLRGPGDLTHVTVNPTKPHRQVDSTMRTVTVRQAGSTQTLSAKETRIGKSASPNRRTPDSRNSSRASRRGV